VARVGIDTLALAQKLRDKAGFSGELAAVFSLQRFAR